MKRPPAPPPPHRPDSRPQSDHRPQMPSAQRTTADVIEPRPGSREPRVEDDNMDAPTDVEVQIAELASKIDRLTTLVVALQSGQGTQMVRT